jgi:hypothetical protein
LLRLLYPVSRRSLPQQLFLFMLQPEDVLLILVQPFHVFCLFSDFTVFIIFNLLAILVELDLFDVTFWCFLSPSGCCSTVRLWLWHRWFRCHRCTALCNRIRCCNDGCNRGWFHSIR